MWIYTENSRQLSLTVLFDKVWIFWLWIFTHLVTITYNSTGFTSLHLSSKTKLDVWCFCSNFDKAFVIFFGYSFLLMFYKAIFLDNKYSSIFIVNIYIALCLFKIDIGLYLLEINIALLLLKINWAVYLLKILSYIYWKQIKLSKYNSSLLLPVGAIVSLSFDTLIVRRSTGSRNVPFKLEVFSMLSFSCCEVHDHRHRTFEDPPKVLLSV